VIPEADIPTEALGEKKIRVLTASKVYRYLKPKAMTVTDIIVIVVIKLGNECYKMFY
jgi:hypothetical protein